MGLGPARPGSEAFCVSAVRAIGVWNIMKLPDPIFAHWTGFVMYITDDNRIQN
jgi:hypothetical protein